ncbi:MAG TPA: transglycosylase SLT domain-containing protein [Telluria sp.]|nr:transglycosylase SLT domain-containing protein [Telluria sp.]
MYFPTRLTPALAALVVAFAPACSQAADNVPSPAAVQQVPAVAKSAVDSVVRTKQADEYKETDLWARIRSGYAIPDIDNQLVANHINWYASRPDYIARTTQRASLYLYHVVTELEKRGMPTELALLPIIESAFNPQANSSANAAGMWQFVPGTGKDFNLKQNLFRDERRGVLASTDAALNYLQKLYGMFGDWQLALAAYNWGEGNVQRAIKKNQAAGKPTDFESLAPLMPVETRNYVPKLQAVKNIIGNPTQYNVSLPPIQNEAYFTAVDKTSDIDVALAAKLADMSVDEFKALNPQFKRPVITGDEQTKILLPAENAEKFSTNLANWGRALSSWTTHKIAGAKDTLVALASRFHTTPEVIREANNIPAKTRLKAGSTILVPKAAESSTKDIAPEVLENAVIALAPDVPDTKRIYVKVGKRDNLASIANRYKVSIAQLKSWNSLNRDSVSKGQSLRLQVPFALSGKVSKHSKAPAGRKLISKHYKR